MEAAQPAPDRPRSASINALRSMQNMSPTEISDFIHSDEFTRSEDVMKGTITNASRLLHLTREKSPTLTEQDRSMVSSAIDTIKRVADADNEPSYSEKSRAKAYGYDRDKDDAAASAPTAGPDDSPDEGDPDDDDSEEGDEDDDEDAS